MSRSDAPIVGSDPESNQVAAGAGDEPICLSLAVGSETGVAPYWSRLAGLHVAAEPEIDVLWPFAAMAPPARRHEAEKRSLRSLALPGAHPVATFDGVGFVGGRDRHLRCVRGDRGWRMEVEGVGAFGLDTRGRRVGRIASTGEPGARASREELVTTLLGPPMMLALATRGRWCLHASAVRLETGVVALLGESGAGKSTLAAHFEERARGTRVGDDALPVTIDDADSGAGSKAEAFAWPRFPQLELSAAAQWRRPPESMPWVAACVLEPAPADELSVRAERLSAPAAALAFVRHTVAARLFDTPLAAAHVAVAAAESLPWWRLRVPRHWSALEAAGNRIAALATGRAGPGSGIAGSL